MRHHRCCSQHDRWTVHGLAVTASFRQVPGGGYEPKEKEMAIAISFFLFSGNPQAGKEAGRIATECHFFDKICHGPQSFTFLNQS
jgi:hypothetical protein